MAPGVALLRAMLGVEVTGDWLFVTVLLQVADAPGCPQVRRLSVRSTELSSHVECDLTVCAQNMNTTTASTCSFVGKALGRALAMPPSCTINPPGSIDWRVWHHKLRQGPGSVLLCCAVLLAPAVECGSNN